MRNLETKKEIRHKIIRLRKEMDPLVWQQTTNTITETVINHPLFLEATDIYCYANYNGETGTLAIMEEAWKLGKSVWSVSYTHLDVYKRQGIYRPDHPAADQMRTD